VSSVSQGGLEPGRSVPVHWLDEIDSTNAEARRRAEAGDLGPVWISALRQSAGRGRRGRVWDTSTGNLAATLLFRTDRSPADAARTSFIAALAVADLVAHFVPGSLVRLKWPNDVMLDGRKVCGVLIDSGRDRDTGQLWLAVGIGVNLAHAPQAVERPATAIADHLKPDITEAPTPQQALPLLSDAFVRHMSLWDQFGFGLIAEDWTRRAVGMGGPCTARLDHETVEGLAEGLEEDGALRLRLADGSLRRISAGDVFFART
jgi:BirA family biotin operon repressor/biotin-[acetyl-CoA-carboxylase] ligase